MSTGPFSFEVFAALVEDTFDHPAGTVHRTTRCDDVSGWDSLGHSVLLARLSKRHRIAMTEADAGRAPRPSEAFTTAWQGCPGGTLREHARRRGE